MFNDTDFTNRQEVLSERNDESLYSSNEPDVVRSAVGTVSYVLAVASVGVTVFFATGTHCGTTRVAVSVDKARHTSRSDNQRNTWQARNERRLALIDKKHARPGLTSEESAELDKLQVEAEERAGNVAALDFEALDQLAERIQRVEDGRTS